MNNKELIKKAEGMLPKKKNIGNTTGNVLADSYYNLAISDSRKALPAIFAMWEKDLRERVEGIRILKEKSQSGRVVATMEYEFTDHSKGFNHSLDLVLSLLSTNPNKEV